MIWEVFGDKVERVPNKELVKLTELEIDAFSSLYFTFLQQSIAEKQITMV